MTCIAWDGRTLAADRLGVHKSTRSAVCKIRRLRDGRLVGFSGRLLTCFALLRWVEDHALAPARFPKVAYRDTRARLLVVELDGTVSCYFGAPEATRFDVHANVAIGSGGPHALAAMHCGCDARAAVQVACEIDPETCGGGIDVLELDPAETVRTEALDRPKVTCTITEPALASPGASQ